MNLQQVPLMDSEHKDLFSCLETLKTDKSPETLASCLAAYEQHFQHEQKLFTASGTYPDEEA